jgi:mannosyl-oligosaccharide alpha-1,2-mannosidase
MYKEMWQSAEPLIVEYLLYRPMTPDSQDILFSGNLVGSIEDGSITLSPEAQHLACFQGGMFAIAGKIFDRPEDVRIGEKLTNGCVWGYESTATGIMPEWIYTVPCVDRASCRWDAVAYNESWTAEGAPPGMPKGFTRVHDDRYLLRYVHSQ